METLTAEQNLHSIIQDTIVNSVTHQDYERVCALSEMYEAFIANEDEARRDDKTGEVRTYNKLNEYLRRFVRREDLDLFEQRKNLTKHYTPAICKQIMHPFNKVVRSNRVTKFIDAKEETKKDEIVKVFEKFYGEAERDGIEQFLIDRFKILTFTDPNAWLYITYKEFDANFEKPQPYPIEYASKDVVNFSIVNDQTQWVIVALNYDYIDKNDKKQPDGRYWLLFEKNLCIEYREIPKNIKEEFEYNDSWIDERSQRKYAVYRYEHKSDRVPLMRVGYKSDILTKSRTFVNPFDEVMPLLKQLLKVSSELQLSITLHAFPKQISYVSSCEAPGCDGGTIRMDGSTCGVCNGSGKKVHTTSADIMEIPLPPAKHSDQLMDINKLSGYIPFPGGVMEFLDAYADKLEKKIIRMMFNSESIMQTQFKTATETQFDMDSIYDTLHPFARKFSEIYMFFGKLTAKYIFTDSTDVVVWHKFPTDFKLKPLSQLMAELKLATDSNAPSYVREAITNDITDALYVDDPDVQERIKIKNKHYPFPGKTETEIQNIINLNLTNEFKKVLWANFDSIFEELETEHSEFYKYEYKKQKELISEKVNALIEELSVIPDQLDLRL